MTALVLAPSARQPAAGEPPAVLEACGVRFGYTPERVVLDGLDLALRAGERLALVGANGAGKSTLLRILGGTLVPQAGEVRWHEQPLRAVSRRRLAQHIAVVAQQVPAGPLEDLTVEEVVALGRTPYAGWLGLRGETAADRRAVQAALAATDAAAFAHRPLAELSGGERQRALLAMALAQEPEVLLLDEPTRHLDPHHQVALLQLVSHLAATQGVAVVAVLHDLNLAAAFFPRLALLHDGRLVADGSPAAVLTAQSVAHAYGAGLAVLPHPQRPDLPLVLPSLAASASRNGANAGTKETP